MKQSATVALTLNLGVTPIRARQNRVGRAPKRKAALATVLCAAVFFQPGLAQVPPASILRIDTANAVTYIEDTADFSRFATDPNVTTSAVRSFMRAGTIADIQAVNGQRVMGTHTRAAIFFLLLRTAPTPGQAIADTVRTAPQALTFEILKSDGTAIGTIMASGLNNGASPPGAPANVNGGNLAVTGGTGAFLGARGQVLRRILRRAWLHNVEPQSRRTPRTGACMEVEDNGGWCT